MKINIKKNISVLLVFLVLCGINVAAVSVQPKKQTIKALYIPLADHYAALLAYERYGTQMKWADFQLEQMKNWDYLRAYFQSGEKDMAFVMSPLAMDMYNEKPDFRWIGLMHRDGNALAINELLNQQVKLPENRIDRKPDGKVARVLQEVYQQTGHAIEIGMPHLLSTHTVILYRYLNEHGLSLSLTHKTDAEVQAIAVAPPKSPAFIKRKSNRHTAAAFEQSLPWADVVETDGYGHVAWYSKDVMPWKNGHVECITLGTDKAIANNQKAVKEVMKYIHQAGRDIEQAREQAGEALEIIVKIDRKHIKADTREAIIASLNPKLRVINYQNLNVDKAGLKQIMGYAVESGVLKKAVNINEFADTSFTIKAADIKSGLRVQ